MLGVPNLTKARRHHRQVADRSTKARLGLGCATLVGLVLAVGGIAAALGYASISRDLPSVELVPSLLNPDNGLFRQPTRLYDSSGRELLLTLENPAARDAAYLYYPNRQNANRSRKELLPSTLISATVAIADQDFWSHPGISVPDLVGNAHPSLARRLVSDLVFSSEPVGLRRSLRERVLAIQLTAQYGRQQVLEWYLNSARFEPMVYGADAASRVFFGKPASQLNLGEAALLAAVADDPARNPFDNLPEAIRRQQQTIQAMQTAGMITLDQARSALQEKLHLQPAPTPGFEGLGAGTAAFTNLVLDQLASELPRERLERGGLRVITSLKFDLQREINCAASTQLERLSGEQTQEKPAEEPGCEAARLLPALPPNSAISFTSRRAEVVVLDPTSGRILALSALSSQGKELAHLAPHPPGTLFTPFVYLTGFTRGLSPASLLWDIPPADEESDTPTSVRAYHGPVRLRIALANDYQVPMTQVLEQVGVQNVVRTASLFGLIPSNASASETLVNSELTNPLTLLEMSHAFTVFSNAGLLSGHALGKESSTSLLHPLTVQRVEDSYGRVLLDWGSPEQRPVITPQLAYLMTDVLGDEPARWPSLGHPNPLEIGRPAAAKTGRLSSGETPWTVGFTPQLLVGVWLGEDSFQLGETAPPAASAGLWHAIMQFASRDLPAETWSMPPGISALEVCDPSGELPTRYCPSRVNEVFLAGNEPVHSDNLYQAVAVNRETGQLATIFTPAEMVAERVFLAVPPEAQSWAKAAGVESLPETYDPIPALEAQPGVGISSPGMFDYVNGKIEITGQAKIPDFDYYRVQVGKGLNPQAWIQLGEDTSRPVQDGRLAVWDTSGLQGLYAIQLLVIRQDKQVEKSIIQVTVDNQPPSLQILQPASGERLSREPSTRITLAAQAEDELALEEVIFYMDRHFLAALTNAPYRLTWEASPGKHTLQVIAKDKAGNQAEDQVEFWVQ